MNAETLGAYLPEEAWFRFNPRGIHGVPHTTRVLVWAEVLAGLVSGPGAIRREELRWAAAVHDVGRVDDGVDRGHGARAAVWVTEELAGLRPETGRLDLGFVAELCRWHETEDRAIERLSLELLVLKDADALDRARLGDLDRSRLRLTRSQRLIEPAVRLEAATDRYGTITARDVLAAAEEQLAMEARGGAAGVGRWEPRA